MAIVRGSVDLACSDWLTVAGDAICTNTSLLNINHFVLWPATATCMCLIGEKVHVAANLQNHRLPPISGVYYLESLHTNGVSRRKSKRVL